VVVETQIAAVQDVVQNVVQDMVQDVVVMVVMVQNAAVPHSTHPLGQLRIMMQGVVGISKVVVVVLMLTTVSHRASRQPRCRSTRLSVQRLMLPKGY
jgi:hypothetical protein